MCLVFTVLQTFPRNLCVMLGVGHYEYFLPIISFIGIPAGLGIS